MIRRKIKEFLGLLYYCYYYIYTYLVEIKNLKLKKDLWKHIHLTALQKREVKLLFQKKISSKWHRLYQYYTGVFDKNYFPEIIFSTKLEPKLCPRNICRVLQDKSMSDILYGSVPGLRLPETIAVNCSGIFYDGGRGIIDEEKAITLIEQWSNNKRFVMKPTVGTHSGMGIFISGIGECVSKDKIRTLIRSYRKNFIVQEYMTNSEELAGLYSKSLNTVRIMTYILDNRLYNAPPIIRIGKGGNIVDNVGMGGLFIGVSEEGYLNKEAYTEFGGRFTHHPDSGVMFEGYYIPNIKKLIECAYLCHRRTPHTKFISWDFTLDENRNPVLIEANLLGHTSWFPQAASGVSTFGSNTARMLELVGIKGQ